MSRHHRLRVLNRRRKRKHEHATVNFALRLFPYQRAVLKALEDPLLQGKDGTVLPKSLWGPNWAALTEPMNEKWRWEP